MNQHSCPICLRTQVTDLGSIQDFRHQVQYHAHLIRCSHCGTRSLLPIPKKADISGFYPKGQYYTHEVHKPYPRIRGIRGIVLKQFYGYGTPNRMLRFFTQPFQHQFAYYPQLVKGGKVLDIGCGDGSYLSTLRDAGWRVFGIDVDSQAVQRCQERGIDATVASGDRIPYPTATFDAVVLKHALEHVTDPRIVLAEVRRVLRKNGELIILLPNGNGLWSRLFGKYWYHLDVPRHIYTFTPYALRFLLEQSQFQVTLCKPVSSSDGLVNSLRYRFGLSESRTWSVLKMISQPLTVLLTQTSFGDLLVASARR